jgi:hypothetical protein
VTPETTARRARALAAVAACLLGLLLGLVLRARPALADGHDELAAGNAAATATPPDVATARARFDAVARGDDARDAAEALFHLGELDEAAFDFPSAVIHYAACGARLPSSPFTPRANRRGLELRTHSEGGFAPLVRLETVRRSPALSNDPAAIDALVRDAAAFPPGKVRVDAWALAAEAYAGRLHRPADAVPLLRLVADDPHADVLTARSAVSELLAMSTAAGDYDGALAIVDKYPKALPPGTRKDVLRLVRRRGIRFAAWGDLAVLAGFALLALARPGRGAVVGAVGRVAPMAALFAAAATGIAGYLASRYEQSNPYPFAAMLPVMLLVSLLARAWSAGGTPKPAARLIRSVVAFAGIFAAAFLVLDRMDPMYLAGFGL